MPKIESGGDPWSRPYAPQKERRRPYLISFILFLTKRRSTLKHHTILKATVNSVNILDETLWWSNKASGESPEYAKTTRKFK